MMKIATVMMKTATVMMKIATVMMKVVTVMKEIPPQKNVKVAFSKDYADISGEDSDEEDNEQIDPQMFTPIK